MTTDNERLAMEAICADCDDIDGYGFTRPSHMISALIPVFGNGKLICELLTKLMEKGLIEVDTVDDTVWIEPEVYGTYV